MYLLSDIHVIGARACVGLNCVYHFLCERHYGLRPRLSQPLTVQQLLHKSTQVLLEPLSVSINKNTKQLLDVITI